MPFKPPKVSEGHFVFGPSSASRWIECRRSIAWLHRVEPRPSGKAALAGSIAHEAFERGVKGGDSRLTDIDRDDITELGFSPFTYQRIIDDALKMLDGLLAQYRIVGLRAEKIVHPGALIDQPQWAGTADVIGTSRKNGILFVADLKTGRLAVPVERNLQMMSYAAGAMFDLKWRPTRIVTAIIQPPVSQLPLIWETTPDEIDRFVDRARISIEAILDGDETPTPTNSNCRWCDCRSICDVSR